MRRLLEVHTAGAPEGGPIGVDVLAWVRPDDGVVLEKKKERKNNGRALGASNENAAELREASPAPNKQEMMNRCSANCCRRCVRNQTQMLITGETNVGNCGLDSANAAQLIQTDSPMGPMLSIKGKQKKLTQIRQKKRCEQPMVSRSLWCPVILWGLAELQPKRRSCNPALRFPSLSFPGLLDSEGHRNGHGPRRELELVEEDLTDRHVCREPNPMLARGSKETKRSQPKFKTIRLG